MMGHPLNIAGSEWIIIIFVALVLILGTGRLPGAARKLGRAVNEYNRAKDDIGGHMNAETKISGPVGTTREKLEAIAESLGISAEGRTDEELQEMIDKKIGQKDSAS